MTGILEQPRYTCALAAQQTVLAIPGALPIVHAGPGCAMKIWQFASRDAGRQGEGYGGGLHIACTNSYEPDIVFGGEKKLRATIEGALKVLKADLFAVLTGCTADIIGDDSAGIAKEYAGQGIPIVGVETAGFKGTSYYGHETIVEAILDQFVHGPEGVPYEEAAQKGLVNVFSIVPYQNPYWRGDLENIKKLLESVGLKAHILYGYGSEGVTEWKTIPEAQFNLLLSPWVGLKTVQFLESKYGTPYFHYPVLPVGAQETSRFLRGLGDFAGIDKALTEGVIKREESRFYRYLSGLADFLTEFRNNLPTELYVVADSAYGIGASAFLANELGFIPKGIYLTDDPPEHLRQGIIETALERESSFKDLIFFQADGGLIGKDIEKRIGNSRKALILGSNWEKFLAQKMNNHYYFISLPIPETVIVNKSFIGYDGGLALTEGIYADLFKTKQHFSNNIVSALIKEDACAI
jgi:nitrogenase molybdenum-iron protein beta chain